MSIKLSLRIKFFAVFLIFALVSFYAQGQTNQEAAIASDTNSALLQGLDKVTGRVSKFALKTNIPFTFGTLELIVRACVKTPPEEPPESTAFIEIREINNESESRSLFSGWMFSSTPGLSSLEHPVYDVWVLNCIDH